MNKILILLPITLFSLLPTPAQAEDYQTICYHRKKDTLVLLEKCTVALQYDHPESGLDWRIVTQRGQIQHYRNRGQGIEVWSHQQKKWVTVVNTDWFPNRENVLCWDDFCADWTGIPLD